MNKILVWNLQSDDYHWVQVYLFCITGTNTDSENLTPDGLTESGDGMYSLIFIMNRLLHNKLVPNRLFYRNQNWTKFELLLPAISFRLKPKQTRTPSWRRRYISLTWCLTKAEAMPSRFRFRRVLWELQFLTWKYLKFKYSIKPV